MTAKRTAIESGANKYFANPERKITGKKTTINVTVETNSGTETSRVPSYAACKGPLVPNCMWRSILSITTMA